MAVSGGVDSVVLLNKLSKNSGLILIVAHFNHGIRKESDSDEAFVRSLAKKYKLEFEVARVNLGKHASEDKARKARYDFLFKVLNTHNAKAIITAHQQDDLIETAIINLIRGTDRKGLSSLKSSTLVLRPMLNITKKQIRDYAKKNNLNWVEDSTNKDRRFLRNRIRTDFMPKLDKNPKLRAEFLGVIGKMQSLNPKIDINIATLSQSLLESNENRLIFTALPDNVAREVVAEILRNQNTTNLNKKLISDSVAHIKTGKNGDVYNIDSQIKLCIGKTKFWFSNS